MPARSTLAEQGSRHPIRSNPRSNTIHNCQPASNQLGLNTIHTFFAGDRRSCEHTMTIVLTIQTLVRMKKKQNFSDEELMQAMGLALPSSKSGTEVHGETVSETMAPIFDEPESMDNLPPLRKRNANSRKSLLPLRSRHRRRPSSAG